MPPAAPSTGRWCTRRRRWRSAPIICRSAGVRGKAAARLGPFTDRVRVLLRSAGVLYADETPARADGHLHYVHVACTEFLTAMHTGGGPPMTSTPAASCPAM